MTLYEKIETRPRSINNDGLHVYTLKALGSHCVQVYHGFINVCTDVFTGDAHAYDDNLYICTGILVVYAFYDNLYIYTLFAYAYDDSLNIFTGDAYAYDDSSSSDSDDEVLKRYQSTLKQRGSIQPSETRQSISKSHSTSAKKKSKFDLSQYLSYLVTLVQRRNLS